MDGEKLRSGIFALRTRRFGSVAECMVKRLLQCSQARSLFHDLYDDAQRQRIEVKFSVVQKKSEQTVTEQTVLRCIEDATAENRMVAFARWRENQFDCNIQQVKFWPLFPLSCVVFKCLSLFCTSCSSRHSGGSLCEF
jgi:hypothetical protein